MTKLLILDKDGTLVRPKSGNTFVQHPEDQEMIEGVAEAIARYIADGWTLAIASNQGGCSIQKCKAADFPVGAYYEGSKVVGKQILPLGVVVLQIPNDQPSPRLAPDTIVEFQYKTLNDAIAEMRYALKLILSKVKWSDQIPELEASFCPDSGKSCYTITLTETRVTDEGGYSGEYRKPGGGMLARKVHWANQYSRKLMIGDRPEDEQAAQAAGFDFMWAEDWQKNN